MVKELKLIIMPDKLIPGEKKTPVYKRSGFKLKSGNNMAGSSFKMMGSSPLHKPTGWRGKLKAMKIALQRNLGSRSGGVISGIAHTYGAQKKKIRREAARKE